MRTTRRALAAILLAFAFAGCSSSDSDPKPAASTAVSASPSSTPSAMAPSSSVEEQSARCVKAIVDQAATNTGELRSDPRPPECSALSDSAYLDAYYDALAEVNRKGRDALSGGSTGG